LERKGDEVVVVKEPGEEAVDFGNLRSDIERERNELVIF
jgi:hypothetical protein